MKKLNIVILAAGKGERMLSKEPKVIHSVMGKPMIGHVVEKAKELSPSEIIVVTGFGREKVEVYLEGRNVNISVQTEQKGTANALLSAEKFINGGDVLVLYGDVPLIESSTLKDFLSFYMRFNSIAFLTTCVDDPRGYGRVIMDDEEIIDIVEDADATEEEKRINEINTGICIIPEERFTLLKLIEPNNKKGEYYLTDICKVARKKGLNIKGCHHRESAEVLGINSKKELLDANITMRDRMLEKHMQKGVTLLDRNIYIESDVIIGRDTIIFPNAYLLGNTAIGDSVVIGPNTVIKNSKINNNVRIDGFTIIEDSELKDYASAGAFSRIRQSTVLGNNVRIGNFVEVKNSVLMDNMKANHHAYIGDAEIGKNVNIGAGTITCNFDGREKQKTIIEDNVFVGSNTAFVAPVKIHRNAVIGAGSVITKNVPEGALAVTRTEQKNIEGYGKRKDKDR
jgi:bifunctional UDP-N-acetylglucosamine pyrophosphorylase / glucosamine-1-phosphate N-acetyltransferase